ncbi:MAG: LLM class flavin-dependent oxidoreductase, partial [Dehalococcoidia bacterium]
ADRRDKDRNYALFKETFDILIKAWTEESFTHKGEFYTFPVPGWSETDPRIYSGDTAHYGPDGELIALGVMPKPYQKPYPPIYQAADSTLSYAFAAEHGISTTGFGRSFEGLREAWTTYKETASRVHGRDIPMGETPDGRTLNAMRLFHMAETQEQAEKEAREGVNAFFSVAAGLSDNWAKKGCIASIEELTEKDMNAEWFDFLMERDIIWVGSPDHVAERIERLRSELNCRHVTLWPNPGFVPFAAVYRSLELFAEKVMPRFEKEEAAISQVGA